MQGLEIDSSQTPLSSGKTMDSYRIIWSRHQKAREETDISGKSNLISRRIFLKRLAEAFFAAGAALLFKPDSLSPHNGSPSDSQKEGLAQSEVIKNLAEVIDISKLLEYQSIHWDISPQATYFQTADLGQNFMLDGKNNWEKVAIISPLKPFYPGMLSSIGGNGKSELDANAIGFTLPQQTSVYLLAEVGISSLGSGRMGISFGNYSFNESNKYLLSVFVKGDGLYFSYYDGGETGGGKLYKGIKYADLPSPHYPLSFQTGIKIGRDGKTTQLVKPDGGLVQIPDIPRLFIRLNSPFGSNPIHFGVFEEEGAQGYVEKLFSVLPKSK